MAFYGPEMKGADMEERFFRPARKDSSSSTLDRVRRCLELGGIDINVSVLLLSHKTDPSSENI